MAIGRTARGRAGTLARASAGAGAALIALIALNGCTPAATRASDTARELQSAIGDRVAEAPRDCVSTMGLDGPQIVGDRTLIYRSGGRIYRNDIAGGCPGLAPMATVIVEVHGSQLCRNDRFQALQTGSRIPGPYCRLGAFTPYRRP